MKTSRAGGGTTASSVFSSSSSRSVRAVVVVHRPATTAAAVCMPVVGPGSVTSSAAPAPVSAGRLWCDAGGVVVDV